MGQQLNSHTATQQQHHHQQHRGHCYGASGGNAESHHNCGGSCRNVHVKSNPYQCETGYGNYEGRHMDDEDTDDGIIYLARLNGIKAKTHYFQAAVTDVDTDTEQPERRQIHKCTYLAEEELASDYDEDIPAIDLSKGNSVESFHRHVLTETVQSLNAEGNPVTVTTIL